MSQLVRDLVAMARRISAAIRLPPVARVFVPAAAPGQANHGSFCAVQLADGSTGVAYVLPGEGQERSLAVDPVGLAGRDAIALAEGLGGSDPAERSLALAAINAVSRHLYDQARFSPDFATTSFGSLELSPDDRLGMVGFFPPLVRRAREKGIPLLVLELKSELVQEAPGLTVTVDPARLAECTQVVCTSTTLLNDSLDAVLAHSHGCREFILIGPSAGCVPDPLFARGVTGIGGTWVADPSALLERMGRGEPWGDATRKSSLRGDSGWPGVEELLRRARR